MGCLGEDEILAFVDGATNPGERRRVAEHLDGCPTCTALIAAAAGGTPAGAPPATAVDAGLSRGANVGRYVILDLVGRGGMGEVYAAYDPQLDRRVAVKLLHQSHRAGESAAIARERLLREAKAIARLSHPNVVVVHDAGAITDASGSERVFVAMEFIQGQTLDEWLAAGPRTWQQIRDVFLAAGEGLAAAHEAGLVHRDFKPQNVMVAGDGSVRVMDFGLASQTLEVAGEPGAASAAGLIDVAPGSKTVALTRTGALVGTPLYMAPEQFLARPTDGRTDQFAFCVALYQALYGERPFAAETLSMLIEAVVAGRVREPPARARVPQFLRRLILRGLAVQPAARFPSMRELLQALGADPARRRRSLLLAGGVVGLACVTALGAHRFATRGQRVCRGGEDRLAGVWERAPAGQRRQAVQAAFVATGRGFAQETWTRVASLLDDYAARWSSLYTDSCEATRVRGDQSEQVLDLRMTCMESARTSIRALTDVLSRVDVTGLARSVDAVQALPPLDRCSDVESLRAVVPLPGDSRLRTQIEAVGRRLAEVRALSDTGQSDTALTRVKPLVAETRSLGYQPLVAEALFAQAYLEGTSGRPAVAAAVFEEAVWAALAGRRDDVALHAAAVLMAITGYHLAQPIAYERWEKLAWALVQRAGTGHDAEEAWFYRSRAAVVLRDGKKESAFDDLKRALELNERAYGSMHVQVADTLIQAAAAYIESGDYGAAIAASDRALAIQRAAYGDGENPVKAHFLSVRGEAAGLAGRFVEADRDLRRSIELWPQLLGPDHPWLAYPMTALGKTLIAARRSAEAVPILEHALRIREKREPAVQMVAETQFALARARWDADQGRDGAVELAQKARATYRTLPQDARHVAEIDAWLAGRRI